MNVHEANELLALVGKRVREMSVEQAVETVRAELDGVEGEKVIVAVDEGQDYLPIVMAVLRAAVSPVPATDDDALREALWVAIAEPWAVPCVSCGATQWVACEDHEPHVTRRRDAALAVLREKGALR